LSLVKPIRPPSSAGARPGLHVELIPSERLRRAVRDPVVQTSGFRPAGLALGPQPGSEELEKMLSRAALTADDPGTPGDPALFSMWPWSTVGKVHVGGGSPAGRSSGCRRAVAA
jgi:hypothetical protein